LSILALYLSFAMRASAQDNPPDAQPATGQEQGMEVMARGPIHEAFAEPVDASPKPGQIAPKQPPAIVEEMPPDQKPEGENVQWIPGYWAWDDDKADFLWVSGIWRAIPPDRQWMPGHWIQMDNGWQWVAGYWAAAAQNTEVRYLPAPPAPLETGASVPAPTPESVYLPGTWIYADTRYVWRPGYWVTYRPGWIWVPAHYIWTPAGYIFVEGYWDFVFAKRGLMFAPIYFTSPLWTRPGWYYRPRYCIWDSFVLTSLFVRPGYYHYYFGDYFEAGYSRRGFVPWFEFRFGLRGYDPLFSYYRWSHRSDPAWSYDMRRLYADRYSGRVPRPPQTLVQQTTIINNKKVNNIAITNVKNMTALAPINSVNGKMVTLRPVPKAELLREQSNAKQFAAVTKQHSQLERQIALKGGPSTRVNATPQTVKIDVPRRTSQTQVERGYKPSPPPPPPPHQTLQDRTQRPEVRRPVMEERIRPKVEEKVKTKVEEKGKPKGDDKNKPKG
jgi:hypothetical protein